VGINAERKPLSFYFFLFFLSLFLLYWVFSSSVKKGMASVEEEKK
jgi:hypothetical protein